MFTFDVVTKFSSSLSAPKPEFITVNGEALDVEEDISALAVTDLPLFPDIP